MHPQIEQHRFGWSEKSCLALGIPPQLHRLVGELALIRASCLSVPWGRHLPYTTRVHPYI